MSAYLHSLILAIPLVRCSLFPHTLTFFPLYYTKKVDTHTFVSVYFPFTGARANAWFAVPGFLILFLDKMVNTSFQ